MPASRSALQSDTHMILKDTETAKRNLSRKWRKRLSYGLQKMSMNMFDGLTGKERYYYEEVLRIGREKGDCQELQDIYRQVLADRVAGNISEEAYRMVYGLCIELAYPRK